jgi:hypothetical protein
MLLILDGLLNLGSKVVSCLLLFDLVNLSEGAGSKFFNDLIPLVENFLTLLHNNIIA